MEMGAVAGAITKRTIASNEARKLAKSIYLELHKLTGRSPAYKKIVEHLARQGISRTASMIGKWRKEDGWAPKADPLPPVRAFYEDGGNLISYEARPDPEDTLDLLVSCLSVHQRAARVFLTWADNFDPRNLSPDQALKFAELIARNRVVIEDCTSRLASHRAFLDREAALDGPGVNGNSQTIEHQLDLPRQTEQQLERSRIASEQAQKILAEAQ